MPVSPGKLSHSNSTSQPWTSSTPNDIDTKVQQALNNTPFRTSQVQKLTGGSVNWIYHATLDSPLDDGTTAVAVKHGEKWMATKPEFELNFVRSKTEAACLAHQVGLPPQVTASFDPSSPYQFTVRTPKLHLYDEENSNIIQEYLPDSTDLKSYILTHYAPNTPDQFKPQCHELGKSLGRWRTAFGQWAAHRPELRRVVAENRDAKNIRHWIHFQWLAKRADDLPHILASAVDVFREVEQMAAAEARDESKLEIVHGDFWTGNAILPNQVINPQNPVPVLVIDWEMAHLSPPAVDLGEMIAELWALWLYKRITAALWILEGFVEGIGEIDEQTAFRTALQAGAHLLCVTTTFPGWGDEEQVEAVAAVGRDVVVNAWKQNREWFESGDLACLFRSSK